MNNDLQNNDDYTNSIVEASIDAVITIDDQGFITSWNKTAETILGWTAQEAIGTLLPELIIPHRFREAHKKGFKRYLETQEGPILNQVIETTALNKNGQEFPVELSIAPLKLKGKIAFCGFLRDISQRKKMENELRKSEEKFRSLAEATKIIPWESDASTFQFTYVGPQAEEILGYPIETWYSHDFWPTHMHNDDRQQAMDYCLASYITKKDYEFEYRMIAANGNAVWFHDVVNVEVENDKPVALRGYLIDITDRKLAEERIQKMNTELEERVSERTAQLRAINEKLEKANIIAEQSKAAKESFLASMSHEIRTPLHAIIGFLEFLKESPLNEEQKEYVESIDFAGRNLLVIINDILDISKIEAGKFELNDNIFNILEVTNSVVELLNQRAKEKNIKIFISQDSSIPDQLYGDSVRLSQILVNLIGNAVKFTEKGEVKVSTRLIDNSEEFVTCEFSVEDTGIGISKDKLNIIFERFSQADTNTTRKYGGTGLGLTISRYLIEMMNGELSVESELGKGSNFSFLLKFRKHSKESTVTGLHFSQTEDEKSNGKLKILLAEDVKLNQRLLMKIMEKWGHDLDIADNGLIAVGMVKEKEYDIILMDIQMPEMDGYQATKLIRNLDDQSKKNIPIIALTAHASHAEAEKCINLGMNAYIIKPFNQDELEQAISRLSVKR